MASAFSDSLMEFFFGGSIPPEISGTTKGMTMKFLSDAVIHKEARNKKRIVDISGYGLEITEQNPENQDF